MFLCQSLQNLLQKRSKMVPSLSVSNKYMFNTIAFKYGRKFQKFENEKNFLDVILRALNRILRIPPV